MQRSTENRNMCDWRFTIVLGIGHSKVTMATPNRSQRVAHRISEVMNTVKLGNFNPRAGGLASSEFLSCVGFLWIPPNVLSDGLGLGSDFVTLLPILSRRYISP